MALRQDHPLTWREALRPWIALVSLLALGFLLPTAVPPLRQLRMRMAAHRCRDQMAELARGEVQHYLDHGLFTTQQRALMRYVPYAERAACPLCRRGYLLEIFPWGARVRCPCPSSLHGWVEIPASDLTPRPQGARVEERGVPATDSLGHRKLAPSP